MIQFAIIPPSTQMPKRSCRAKIVDRLEGVMREIAFAGQTVNLESLKQHGFSQTVIEAFGEQAICLARRRSVRQSNADRF